MICYIFHYFWSQCTGKKNFRNIQTKILCHVTIKVELHRCQKGSTHCYRNQQFCHIWSNSINHFVAYRIMELRLTLPVMSTMVVSWEKRRPMLRTENLPPSCADCLENSGALRASPGLYYDKFFFLTFTWLLVVWTELHAQGIP
jgi:hypothetical protein